MKHAQPHVLVIEDVTAHPQQSTIQFEKAKAGRGHIGTRDRHDDPEPESTNLHRLSKVFL